MTGLFCCGNDASLPQHNKQVTRSVSELRSLAIGVSQRDPFVELIDVTAEHLIAHDGYMVDEVPWHGISKLGMDY